MGDLAQLVLHDAESDTPELDELVLTEQQIACVVAAGGGRYVGLLEKIPGKMETVILFNSPKTGTTLGLRVSRFNVEAVRERIVKSNALFAKWAAR